MSGMRVLITGAGGFIGHVSCLEAKGCLVRVGNTATCLILGACL
jgi:hypothetical protein